MTDGFLSGYTHFASGPFNTDFKGSLYLTKIPVVI